MGEPERAKETGLVTMPEWRQTVGVRSSKTQASTWQKPLLRAQRGSFLRSGRLSSQAAWLPAHTVQRVTSLDRHSSVFWSRESVLQHQLDRERVRADLVASLGSATPSQRTRSGGPFDRGLSRCRRCVRTVLFSTQGPLGSARAHGRDSVVEANDGNPPGIQRYYPLL